MKLRTRLVLAFVVLAVMPLVGIVGYSYGSSIGAFRRAVEAESRLQAETMNQRLASVREELDRRVAAACSVSLEDEEPVLAPDPELAARFGAALGPAASLLEHLEFIPQVAAPAAAGAPAPADAPTAAEAPTPPRRVVVHLPPEVPLPPEQIEALIERAVSQLEANHVRTLTAEHARAVQQATEALREARREQAERRRETRETAGWVEQLRRPVTRDGKVVGHVEGTVRANQMLYGVLASTPREDDAIPFAVDREGRLHAVSESDRETLASVPLTPDPDRNQALDDDWIVTGVQDPSSGITFGIARPLGEGLREIRRTAVRNLGLGLGLIALSVVTIVPTSRRVTRPLEELTSAADALAAGDLTARVAHSSRDEVGRLANAFNRMAADLGRHQERIREEERERREQEVRHHLLEAEHQRKTRELEEARAFQLSLLPATLPDHPELELAAAMRTATEVGGDYYDVRTADDGSLAVAVGDATGHGVAAGTLVTVVKSLFATGDVARPLRLLEDTARAVRSLRPGRMNVALSAARLTGRTLELAAAGMPPALVHRSTSGVVDEVLVPGLPLGALADAAYRQVEVPLAAGDTVLLLSDGLPELRDASGAPFGYERVRSTLGEAADGATRPEEVVDRLFAAADAWRGDQPLEDDITLLVVRVR